MGFFSSLINAFNETSQSSSTSQADTHPCANCPSDCAIAGAICSTCEPYKKKLIDQVYWINHLEDYYNQYEVVSEKSTTVVCPYCGGLSENKKICDYCGSTLNTEGKIQVSAASEIPNPIMEAQNIIYRCLVDVWKQRAKLSLIEMRFVLNIHLSKN